MTLPTGTIGMSQIQAEYGGANPIGLSEYRSKGNNNGSNPIAMSQFRGTSAAVVYQMTSSGENGYARGIFGALTPNIFKGREITGISYNPDQGGGDQNFYYFTVAKLTSEVIDRSFLKSMVTNGHTFISDQYTGFSGGVGIDYASWAWQLADPNPLWQNGVVYPVTVT